jgi:hypothetical protein
MSSLAAARSTKVTPTASSSLETQRGKATVGRGKGQPTRSCEQRAKDLTSVRNQRRSLKTTPCSKDRDDE